MASWDSPPAAFSLPFRMLLLVQGYGSLGRTAEALGVIEQGIHAYPPDAPTTLVAELWRGPG